MAVQRRERLFLTIDETAELLGVSKRTVARWILDGFLDDEVVFRVGRVVRVYNPAVLAKVARGGS